MIPSFKQPVLQLVLIASILGAVTAFPSEPYIPAAIDPNLENWRWTEYPFLDGRGVTCMTEEPEAIYWFGGAGAIYRYDGYAVEKFGPETGYLGSVTLSLATSPTGTVYAGSDQGLFRFTEGRWDAVLASREPGRIQIRDIDFLPDGSILASIGEIEENAETPKNWHGLAIIKNDTAKFYSDKSPSPDESFGIASRIERIAPPSEACIQMLDTNTLNAVASLLASDGFLYCAISENNGEDNRIVRFEYHPETFELRLHDSFSKEDGINIDSLANLIESADGEIWATSNSAINGVCRWDGESWFHATISETFPGAELFYHSLRASDGTIWVDGFGQYFIYRSGIWTQYAPPEIPLTANNRINFFEAADGAMWLIATNSKVFRLDYANRDWSTLKGLAFQMETAAGENCYLSENGRLVLESSGNWTSFDARDGLIDTPVRALETSYGEIWVIGSHRGVAALSYREPSGKWTKIEYPNLSWGLDHRSAFEDREGRLYFAATVDASSEQKPGVIRFNQPEQNKSDWTLIRQQPPISSKGSFYGIGQDIQGRIWVGGRPVVTIEDDHFRSADTFSTLSTYVDHIFNQPDGGLWLLSRDQGILQISDKGESWHTVDSGLPSHSVISGLALSSQNVWVALSDQIAHFDGTSWSTFMALPNANYTRASIFLSQGSRDELHITQMNTHWTRRALQQTPIELGKAPFQTLTHYGDDLAPEITITHFEPKVSDRGNTSITWQAIDYLETTPRKDIEYSFKLDQEAWTPFSRQDHELFIGLPHGPHTLQVRARDHSFNISPQAASVSFTVAAPVWRQIWFQATILVLAVLVFYFCALTIKRNKRLEFLNSNLTLANQRLQLQQNTIASQNETLLKNKSHLEDRVSERTRDLEKAKIRAEESDRLKSAFLANVSHEIRTPMNAIIGFSELLTHSKWENEEERNFVKIIRNSGNDLQKLIDDIIEVSKIESDHIELEFEDSPVDWILSQTQDTFRGVLSNYERDNLQFLVDKNELPAGCILKTDPNRLKQVLANLVSNAIKFTPDGYVRLGCRPVDEGKALEFSVEDSGFGIKQEQLARIFERFHKADVNSGHSYRGSGLGLGISQSLLSKLGGTINVQSEFGKGSRFSFSLPWDGKVEPVADRDAPVPEDLERPSVKPQHPILLVEDEEANYTLMATMLKRLRVPFVHVTTGEQAVALCKRKVFSAVLMDIKLPEMQGDEAALLIRKIAPKLPIISQTAYAMAGERKRYSQEPFAAYLPKPLSIESLAKTLHSTLHS